jgi:hydroxymethylbilane synthase
VTAVRELRIGTRGSALALWQANTVAARIAAGGGPATRLVVIRTSGDQLQEAPLSAAGGKRLFVKEIEDALLRGEVDCAVHSSKDMPAALPDGLAIAGVLPREDPRDAVVLAPTRAGDVSTVDDLVSRLGRCPRLGTGSVRRVAQLSRLFSGARFGSIRGNLDTRLRKLDAGEHDALVLAAAGLRRLGLASRISFALPATACVPAPGQGIVAIEIRADDDAMRALVASVGDGDTSLALAAERALVEALGGGCQTPLGALATHVDRERMELTAVVVALDGTRAIRATRAGSRASPDELGARVAASLIAEGAGDILADARRAQEGAVGDRPSQGPARSGS